MGEALRVYARNQLANVFGLGLKDPKVVNAEISIHNWVVSKTPNASTEASWENAQFRWRYKQRVMSIMYNLKKNPVIIESVMTRKIKSSEIGSMTSEQLWPEGPHATMMTKMREKEMRKEMFKAQEDDAYEGLLTCPKCKSKKTSYYQMQTRSADEVSFPPVFFVQPNRRLTIRQPATNFCSCVCGHRWRFC